MEASDEMTIEMCLSICREKNYKYAGLQWQCECHCGNEPEIEFEPAWFGKCSDRCAGDSSQICGGSEAMNVWSADLDFEGLCIYDFPFHDGALNEYSLTGTENMTIDTCRSICQGFLTICNLTNRF